MRFFCLSFLIILCTFTLSVSSQQRNIYQGRAGASLAQNATPQPGRMQSGQLPNISNQRPSDLNAMHMPNNNTQNGITPLTENTPAAIQQQDQENNRFLEYYSRQGVEFSASVYYQEGKKLVKRNISQDNLKKAIVVFFGDWCPHCDKFLRELSTSTDMLQMYGINITFISVPSIERLKNWQEPNVDEFNAAENKISSYGIKLSKKVNVALLGDKKTLAETGVEGLPVITAIENGKERFRGVGESGTSKLQLSIPLVLKQFLKIWDNEKDDEKQIDGKDVKKVRNSEKPQKKDIRSKKSKPTSGFSNDFEKYKVGHSKVNILDAKKATEFLNNLGINLQTRLTSVVSQKKCSCSNLNS
jgi:thiol-disulfide isomerase/thioredoxin